MLTPTIHLNGSSRDALIEQQSQVLTHLRAAVEAMRQASPHARDYYPQGDHAFEQARLEHMARLAQLESVMGEVMTIAGDPNGASEPAPR